AAQQSAGFSDRAWSGFDSLPGTVGWHSRQSAEQPSAAVASPGEGPGAWPGRRRRGKTPAHRAARRARDRELAWRWRGSAAGRSDWATAEASLEKRSPRAKAAKDACRSRDRTLLRSLPRFRRTEPCSDRSRAARAWSDAL